MNRLMMTVAVAALIPAFALAESHSSGDMDEDAMKPKTEQQAETADPMAEDADATEMAEDDDPMNPEGGETDMAEGDDAMTPAADETDMAADDAATGGKLGLTGMIALSEVEGGAVYTLSSNEASDWDVNMTFDAVGDNWERIGSIEDVVLDETGKIHGIVTEVGGFLGIGDKLVMLPLNEMKLVKVDDDDYAVVTPFTSDQLTDMQGYEDAMMD